MLQNGQSWLASQLKQHASREVEYQRGAETLTVSATIGRTLLKLDDGYGGCRMQWTDRDFLIAASELVIGGSITKPQRGDLIKETLGSVVSTYEVTAVGGEPPWRPSDPFGILLRIHTKLIAQEAA